MRFPEYFYEQNLPFRDNRDKVSADWAQKAGDRDTDDRGNRFGRFQYRKDNLRANEN
jgi:hypothetical protein